MFDVQLILGFFPFMVSTATFEELTESTTYEWAELKPIGQAPVLQYVGPGAPSIAMRGRLMPPFTGGAENIRRLRAMAELGVPLNLIAGTGLYLGRWVIEDIQSTGRFHVSSGSARLEDFSLKIKKADNGAGKLAKGLAAASKIIGQLL